MRNYFKHYAESDAGIGTVYFETEDDLVLRQVEIYGDQVFWADRTTQSDPRYRICDQPVSILGLSPDEEMAPSEFESVWNRAKRKQT
jgi:hypothetical protein